MLWTCRWAQGLGYVPPSVLFLYLWSICQAHADQGQGLCNAQTRVKIQSGAKAGPFRVRNGWGQGLDSDQSVSTVRSKPHLTSPELSLGQNWGGFEEEGPAYTNAFSVISS